MKKSRGMMIITLKYLIDTNEPEHYNHLPYILQFPVPCQGTDSTRHLKMHCGTWRQDITGSA